VAKRDQPRTLSGELRAILLDELQHASLGDLARDSGVDRSVLSRFIRGERGMKLETADQLAALFRLRLTGPGLPATRSSMPPRKVRRRGGPASPHGASLVASPLPPSAQPQRGRDSGPGIPSDHIDTSRTDPSTGGE
jgi:hypothetical protein